ncbi:hypothetical protein VNO77_12119 [Canavalia gladiata]|uniref:Uncharacterized protein n=1 Tax=Canavalia gladiata TaxID=3824 RepID=A0AAN9LX01_CANGL
MHVPVLIHSFHHYLQKQHSFFLSQLQPSSVAYTLCKWSALILTFLAAVLVIKLQLNAPSIPLLLADHDYSDTDDDDGMSLTSSSSEFEDDDDEEEEEEEEEKEEHRRGEYFRVTGSSTKGNSGFLRRRSIGDFLSLSEIANSKSVVKLWDAVGFGLGFGSEHSDGSLVSIYSANEDHGLRSIPSGKSMIPATSCASPAVVVSAVENASGNLALRVWDTRLRQRIPAVIADWGPSRGKTLGVESGGVQKVYVRDDGRYGLTVGDMRNVTSPLENVTESHLDLWWPNSFMLKI